MDRAKFENDRYEAAKKILVSYCSDDELNAYNLGADWAYDYCKAEIEELKQHDELAPAYNTWRVCEENKTQAAVIEKLIGALEDVLNKGTLTSSEYILMADVVPYIESRIAEAKELMK